MNITVYVFASVCVCVWRRAQQFSPSVGVESEEQQFPLEEKSHQRHQKTEKHGASISGRMSIISQDQPESMNPNIYTASEVIKAELQLNYK